MLTITTDTADEMSRVIDVVTAPVLAVLAHDLGLTFVVLDPEGEKP